MKYDLNSLPPRRLQGFVLVTSLVFLVVITLLAVSAINSSTLQERMASNLREKARARQAADAALRHGEMLLKATIFNTQQERNSTISVKPLDRPAADDDSVDIKLWSAQDPTLFGTDVKKTDPAAFLNPAIWNIGNALSYTLDPKLPVEFYVEDYGCDARDLNPESAAKCDGAVIYRFTARAQGENPAAIAVTQSYYEKHY